MVRTPLAAARAIAGLGEVMLLGLVRVAPDEPLSASASQARLVRQVMRQQDVGGRTRSLGRVLVSTQPVDELFDAVREEDPELLILEYPCHFEALGASLAEVMQHSPCDLAIVRGPIASELKNILVPLRGGPYAVKDQFCYRCHLEDKQQLSNPHRQIDPFGRVRIEACRFCHRIDPDLSKPKAPGNFQMVGDEIGICANCHKDRPHPDRDHNVPMSGDKLARKIAYEERHQVILPLGEGNMVKCTTCHNPHAKGVLKGESGVGAGSKWRVPDFREVCAPCHGRL